MVLDVLPLQLMRLSLCEVGVQHSEREGRRPEGDEVREYVGLAMRSYVLLCALSLTSHPTTQQDYTTTDRYSLPSVPSLACLSPFPATQSFAAIHSFTVWHRNDTPAAFQDVWTSSPCVSTRVRMSSRSQQECHLGSASLCKEVSPFSFLGSILGLSRVCWGC